MTLKEWRASHNVTQMEMAESLQVDIRTIKRWEADPEPPRRVRRLYETVLNGASDVEESVIDGSTPIPIADVIEHKPETLPIKGPYADLLGSLPQSRQFTILISGASGAGKSSLTLRICSALSEHGSVLYCSSEERIDSGTIGTRAEHVGVDDADIDVVEVTTVEEVESHLREGLYDFCVIDSINELDISPEEAQTLMRTYPNVSFLLIAQADATEKRTVGGARWRHLVDIRLWCERDKDGRRIVKNIKNRFAPRVDEVVISGPQRSTRRFRPNHPPSLPPNQTTEDSDMADYSTWIISRLESDLASAQREIEALRTKLEEKDEKLRSVEMRLMRFEIEAETLASHEEHGSGGMGDNLDPNKLISSIDKIAPIASVVGDLIRMFRPEQPSLAEGIQHAPSTTPPPSQFQYASPYSDTAAHSTGEAQ